MKLYTTVRPPPGGDQHRVRVFRRAMPKPRAGSKQAANVTIVRDDWGIAHVYGKTDADAVFGMIYAQAEDDFNRVETNYINAMGRLAEAEGESRIYQDLRMKLFIDPDALKNQYAASPAWLKTLMNAFADGLNYYLSKHPEVKPRVIQHFEPWMALSLHRGQHRRRYRAASTSISLQAFYGKDLPRQAIYRRSGRQPAEPRGSNGMAIAPSNTAGAPRPAADQSAHVLLLPLRIADGQRPGAERLWRRDLGPVLHLPGLQRTHRLDAHLERRRCGGRVSGDACRRRATASSTSTATRSVP